MDELDWIFARPEILAWGQNNDTGEIRLLVSQSRADLLGDLPATWANKKIIVAVEGEVAKEPEGPEQLDFFED